MANKTSDTTYQLNRRHAAVRATKLAERIISDIKLDMKGGAVPETVGGFRELMRYVDIAGYEADGLGEVSRQAIERVDQWLQARAFAGAL